MTMELSAPQVSPGLPRGENGNLGRGREPIVGIKSAATCFMILALSVGRSIIQSSKILNKQQIMHNATTLQSHPRVSSANNTEEKMEKMAGGVQIVEANEQQIMHNTTFFPAKETSSSFKVAHYQFPSIQERLQYYMGDWYNKSDWTVPDCQLLLTEVTDYNKVFDRNVVLNTTGIKECVERGEQGISRYCTDAYESIDNY
jgi:hypothetical protein